MLTIYKASAGSGKTYTLAYEYIKLLLGIKLDDAGGSYVLNSPKYAPSGVRRSNRHRAILAITFTNAATEEMKSRIVREVDRLAGDGRADYRERLCAEFGCTSDELRQAAGAALGEMLYDYGNFNVSTIDSFFQTVLRTFSREVDHQGDYELSLDLRDIVAQSISLMLDELNYARPADARRLTEWIRSYAFTRLGEGGSYNFFNRSGNILTRLARSVADALGDETYTRGADALREYCADPSRIAAFDSALAGQAGRLDADVAAAAARFASHMESAGIPADVYNKTVRARVEKAIADASSLRPKDLEAAAIQKLLGSPGIDDLFLKTKKKAYAHFGAELDTAVELAAAFAATACSCVARRGVLAAVRGSLPLLEFIGMAEKYLQAFLKDSNLVLISDTGDLLRRIISDAEMPFIYERLGMKLDSLLIDEFQDTSHLQWHNLRPLVANSIAEGHDCLIIGDEKQAIYRFRNSDSALLGHIVGERDFPASHTLRGTDPADNTNYRSAGAIVRFNNSLFRRMARLRGADSYGNVVQTPSRQKADTPAYIRLKFVDTEADGMQEQVFAEMAREILRQHDAGYRWRDILILTRERKEAKAAAEYLIAHHPEIRLLSSEALMLNSSGAVRSIIGMLKLVERSYASPSEASRAPEAPKYASQSDIVMMISRFDYFRGEGCEPEEALELALGDASEASGALGRQVMDIRAGNPANLVALIEAIIACKIPKHQREAEYAYIAALQDIAVKHCDGPDPSLATFLADYDRNVERWSIKAAANLDAVEIMTVHKSKGLERACVHMPAADWKLRRTTDEMWIPVGDGAFDGIDDSVVPPLLRVTVSTSDVLKTPGISPFADFLADNDRAIDADNLNLAYVAYTRASRELCVYSGRKAMGTWLAEAFESGGDAEESSNPSLMPLGDFYSIEDGLFAYGYPTVPEEKEEEKSLADAAGAYRVSFRDDTRELTAIDDILAGDGLDIGGEEEKEISDSAPAGGLMAEAARRGNDLHTVLASMRTIGELEASVARLAARLSLPAAVAAEYRAELEAAFEAGGEQARAWFDPVNKVYAERSIYVPETGESFRPDRVVVSPDGGVTVVDYKFTTEPRTSHRRQVEVYLGLMRRLGRKEVAGYLWYPLLGKIIKV